MSKISHWKFRMKNMLGFSHLIRLMCSSLISMIRLQFWAPKEKSISMSRFGWRNQFYLGNRLINPLKWFINLITLKLNNIRTSIILIIYECIPIVASIFTTTYITIITILIRKREGIQKKEEDNSNILEANWSLMKSFLCAPMMCRAYCFQTVRATLWP